MKTLIKHQLIKIKIFTLIKIKILKNYNIIFFMTQTRKNKKKVK